MGKNLAQSAKVQRELRRKMEPLVRALTVFLAGKWTNIPRIRRTLGYRFKLSLEKKPWRENKETLERKQRNLGEKTKKPWRENKETLERKQKTSKKNKIGFLLHLKRPN